MNRKQTKQYTTIQVSKEINKYIRAVCLQDGVSASTLTEQYWLQYISSSMSGSTFYRENI
jgi:hypothetical protein